jgi:F-type H+-transporting ATPase subunit b
MTFILNNALITPNIGLMFWTILTFVVLLIVLRKFAWGPILSGLKERETSIENALSEAQLAREEMKNLRAENENLLNQARAERDKMLKEAKETREKLISDAKTQAQEEGKKIVAQAKESINKEKEQAFRELKEQVVILSTEAASRILKRELSAQQNQEALIETYLNDVNPN